MPETQVREAAVLQRRHLDDRNGHGGSHLNGPFRGFDRGRHLLLAQVPARLHGERVGQLLRRLALGCSDGAFDRLSMTRLARKFYPEGDV